MNCFLDRALKPVQTQSSEKNFARPVSFCCSSFAVSASILRRACSSDEPDTPWLRVEGIERKSPAIKTAHRIRMIYLLNLKIQQRKIYRRDRRVHREEKSETSTTECRIWSRGWSSSLRRGRACRGGRVWAARGNCRWCRA